MVVAPNIKETDKAWLIDLKLNSNSVVFKLDTGATVTAIPTHMKRLVSGITKSDKLLKSAGNHKLNVSGCAEVTLSVGRVTMREHVYLVDDLVTPLLGKPAISKLGLLQFADEIGSKANIDWVACFPNGSV